MSQRRGMDCTIYGFGGNRHPWKFRGFFWHTRRGRGKEEQGDTSLPCEDEHFRSPAPPELQVNQLGTGSNLIAGLQAKGTYFTHMPSEVLPTANRHNLSQNRKNFPQNAVRRRADHAFTLCDLF